MALRLLEHYTSVQGEGPRTGELTQFIRFAGCNLKCPKWPCDTPEAIDPKIYRKEQRSLSPEQIAADADGQFVENGSRNICLTGGEPMLQLDEDIDDLIRRLTRNQFSVEMFSNGTLTYTEMVLAFANIVMDWKLPGSGEDPSNRERIENVKRMNDGVQTHSIKFTVADEKDLEVALHIQKTYLDNWMGEIWVGPVWDQCDPKDVVEFIKTHSLSWRLNLQTHKFVYGNVRSV